jgi:type II secretory pathway component PulM
VEKNSLSAWKSQEIKTLNITERDRRVLMIGGVVAVLYVLTTFVFKPIYSKQARVDKEIQSKIQFIEKYYEVLNQKSYYEAKSKENQEANNALEAR